MTITEIQAALDSLRVRHADLDEHLLVTLLEAGGWEKGDIKEAQVVFRLSPEVSQKDLPSPHDMLLAEVPQEEAIEVPPEEIVTEGLPLPAPLSEELPKLPERESLIREDEMLHHEDKKLPDNLTLKPFESSPHTWSFARYKEVFHGDVMPEVVPAVTPSAPTPEPVREEEKSPKVSVPFAEEDKGLVITASFLFLLVLLILGYMYAYGRI